MLVKFTGLRQEDTFPLCENIARLFHNCSAHAHLGEHVPLFLSDILSFTIFLQFKNNSGYYSLVQAAGNLVAPANTNNYQGILRIILQVKVAFETLDL